MQRYASRKKDRNLSVLLVLLSLLLFILGIGGEEYFSLLQNIDRFCVRSAIARQRRVRLRMIWAAEQRRISGRMFYRLFRMKKLCFVKLCNKIKIVVGEKEFKSEAYIENLKNLGYSTKESQMYQCHLVTCGEYVPGEVELAITLQILAGASYLDMFLWYNISPDHARKIFRTVTKNWICNDKVIEINFYKNVLHNPNNIKIITEHFAEKSDGVLSGIIGALDGWLVRIKCPAFWEADNAGKYYSHKGFYAINVQVIVDRNKIVLWRYIGAKGCSYDSPVLNESRLGQQLKDYVAELKRLGLYIIGDSAYAICSYLLTPYDNAKSNSKEDNFNFFHSSSRIHVECAFGEIDRRWGILWKPLEGGLSTHRYTIDSCLQLHNFIVQYQLNEDKATTIRDDIIENEMEELNEESRHYYMMNPLETPGVVSEDYFVRHGRRTNYENAQRDEGKKIRDELCSIMANKGMLRATRTTSHHHDRYNRLVCDQ